MAKRSKVKLEPIEKIIRELPARTAALSNRTIAVRVRQKILDLVLKGISPIEGAGRFPAYKNPKNYPDKQRGDFPSKRRRPVNLLLSGKFLRQLKSFPRRLNVIAVGFFSPYGEKLEQGHREGANGQPSRPIIPSEGEDFTKLIRSDILKTYTAAVKDYLKRTR